MRGGGGEILCITCDRSINPNQQCTLTCATILRHPRELPLSKCGKSFRLFMSEPDTARHVTSRRSLVLNKTDTIRNAKSTCSRNGNVLPRKNALP